MLRIGQTVADISLKTTVGEFGVHEYFKDRAVVMMMREKKSNVGWGLLVCYVADFSAVCTDELSQLVKNFHEFESRGIKILAMSCDSINSHAKWIEDIKKVSGLKHEGEFPFPIVSDRNRMISLYLNVLDAKCMDEDGIPLPCRAAFVLAPDMTIQLIHFYPQNIGRNFDDIFRTIDALQLTFKFSNDLHTPCGWKPVADCLISSKIPKDEIEKKFPSTTVIELPSGKDYMRIVSKIEVNRKIEK